MDLLLLTKTFRIFEMVRRKNVALGKVDSLKMSFVFLGSLKNSIPVISLEANA